MLAHPLVDALVAAAQHHDVTGLRQPPASACVNRRPAGDISSTASGAPARLANRTRPRANSGSGFSTIPGPPPNGTSSTVRWRSVVKSRRSWTTMSSNPLVRAASDDALDEPRFDHAREDRDDVELHDLPRASGRGCRSRSSSAAMRGVSRAIPHSLRAARRAASRRSAAPSTSIRQISWASGIRTSARGPAHDQPRRVAVALHLAHRPNRSPLAVTTSQPMSW